MLCGGISEEHARLSFAASARRAADISRPCTLEAIEVADADDVAAEVSTKAVLAVAVVFAGPLGVGVFFLLDFLVVDGVETDADAPAVCCAAAAATEDGASAARISPPWSSTASSISIAGGCPARFSPESSTASSSTVSNSAYISMPRWSSQTSVRIIFTNLPG